MSNEKEQFLSELNALLAKHNCNLCVETKTGAYDDSFECDVYSFKMPNSDYISMEAVWEHQTAQRNS